MLKITIPILRIIGLVEGSSYLLLLFVAMPLKYIGGEPLAVRVVGSLHGALFVAYLLAALAISRSLAWPLRRLIAVVLAAILPFGPFVIDRSLRDEQKKSN